MIVLIARCFGWALLMALTRLAMAVNGPVTPGE